MFRFFAASATLLAGSLIAVPAMADHGRRGPTYYPPRNQTVYRQLSGGTYTPRYAPSPYSRYYRPPVNVYRVQTPYFYGQNPYAYGYRGYGNNCGIGGYSYGYRGYNPYGGRGF